MALSPGYDGVIAPPRQRQQTRTKEQVKALRRRAKRLRRQGLTYVAIGQSLDISMEYAFALVTDKAGSASTNKRIPPTDGGVPCLICGTRLRNLGTHVKAHGLTSAEYRAQFPGAVMSNSDVKAIASALTLDRGHAPYWTKERVVLAMKRWAARHGQPPTYRDWSKPGFRRRNDFDGRRRTWPCVTTVRELFGTWDGALRAAGFEPRGQGRQQQDYFRCGHPYVESNIRRDSKGRANCCTCARAHSRAYRQRQKLAKRT